MIPRVLLAALCLIMAGSAFAHSGVKNATVRARMVLMEEIKDATAIIGEMVKGKRPFDAAQAGQAKAMLTKQADQILAAFKAQESDPKSQARNTIWSDWAGFEKETKAMQKAVTALKTGTRKELRSGMRALGQSCGGCHKRYRVAD